MTKENPLRKSVIAVFFALLASVQALAQNTVVSEQADGSVIVSMESGQLAISATVADAVELAVREHADDPEALRQAIRALIGQNAAGSGASDLATAIATLAVFHAGTDSASIAAIVHGASEGNSNVSGGAMLAAIPALSAGGNSLEADERELASAQATVENPSQVSPVQ